jgi:hypothetical protein
MTGGSIIIGFLVYPAVHPHDPQTRIGFNTGLFAFTTLFCPCNVFSCSCSMVLNYIREDVLMTLSPQQYLYYGGFLFVLYFIISSLFFIGWLCLGIGICFFMPDAAICNDTIGAIAHFTFIDLWNPIR